MIIKKMTACFGRLDHAELAPRPGLNIIHAPNESGKSTWCAFLRAMLYGIPTRDRDKKGYLAEKNRYQPWSGAPMEGELTLEWQGRDITLRRFTKGAAPFGGFSAVYADTQQPVPELTAQNCGETILGVGREVWERSAFVDCVPNLAIDGTPELERRINALFSSGQEDVSFSQTEAKLREWQRRRQHNRSGLIPQLEEELVQVERTLEQLLSANGRLSQIREQRCTLEERLHALEEELRTHRLLAQQELNSRFAQAQQEQVRIRTQLDDLMTRQAAFGPLPHRDRLRDAQSQLQRLSVQEEELLQQEQVLPSQPPVPPEDPHFPNMDGAQALRLAQDERMQAERLLEQAQKKDRNRLLCLLPVLLLPLTAALIGLAADLLLPALLVGAPTGALIGVALFFRNRSAAARLRSQTDAILDRRGVAQPQQLTDLAQQYHRSMEEFALARESYARQVAQQASRRTALEQTSAELLRFVRTFAPHVSSLPGCSAALSDALELEDRLRECRTRLDLAARHCEDLKAQGAQQEEAPESLFSPAQTEEQTRQALSQCRTQLAALDQQEAMTRGELLTVGDRTQLEARRDQLRTQLDRRRQEFDAISLALDALRQANASLQARFAPELNRCSGQILSQLTGGRYQSLSLDRDFDASAQSADSLLPRSALSLSRGTADQIYLAVRLAVCQLCLPSQDPSPLVLDDALLTCDDERMTLALDYLARSGRQVLLFSCQKRESAQGIGNILSLQS